MSDRYRPPPAAPKGPRGPPPGPAGSSGGSGKSTNNRPPWKNSGPPPKRYKERDNYRPHFSDRREPDFDSRDRKDQGFESRDRRDQDDSRSRQESRRDGRREDRDSGDRPVGPSGYRGQKRGGPNDNRRRTDEPPNKRRDFSVRDGDRVNLERAPKGPGQGSGPGSGQGSGRDKRTPLKKKQGKKPQPRLLPLQMYSLLTNRSSELYQRVQQVGEGTYGKVYKAKNTLTEEFVALKRLRLESEREGFPITAIREIKLLQSFDHTNVVGLLEMMVEHNQIFMIFDYLDHDLTGLLTHPELNLTEGHRKMIFKQLMEGMNYLHKKRIIHRDIKGSNILLDRNGVLKIADFGLARTMKVLNAGESPDYTNRVITIWYRPPELLLGSTDYGREVDIWGVGCLLMELYTKNALFQGTEEILQLFRIFEVMGTPSTESWPDIENLPWFEMLKPKINRKSRFERDFRPVMTADSFDLAAKMLTLVPGRRITAEDALKHEYFHNEPKPEPLKFMETLEGEWHEFETKKRRREERKRLAELKSSKRDVSLPPTQPAAPDLIGDLSNLQTPVLFEKNGIKVVGDELALEQEKEIDRAVMEADKETEKEPQQPEKQEPEKEL